MHIFYINLDTQPERRARLERQLADLGLAATRIRATTPADISPDRLARYCPGPAPWWLTAPELACTHSHVDALRRIAEGPAPFGMVLEDDAVLAQALPGFLAAFAALAPPVDIVKLDGFGERVLVPRDPPMAIGGAALRRIVSFRPGTTGYVVSKAAAARLLGQPRLLAAPIDATLYYPFLSTLRDMRVRHVEPALCTQRIGPHGDSSVEGPRNAARRARKLHRTWRDTLLRTLHQRGLQLHDGLCVLGGARRLRSTLASDLVARLADPA